MQYKLPWRPSKVKPLPSLLFTLHSTALWSLVAAEGITATQMSFGWVLWGCPLPPCTHSSVSKAWDTPSHIHRASADLRSQSDCIASPVNIPQRVELMGDMQVYNSPCQEMAVVSKKQQQQQSRRFEFAESSVFSSSFSLNLLKRSHTNIQTKSLNTYKSRICLMCWCKAATGIGIVSQKVFCLWKKFCLPQPEFVSTNSTQILFSHTDVLRLCVSGG